MKTISLTFPTDRNRAPRSVRRLAIQTCLAFRLRQTLVALLIAALVLTALPLAERVTPPAQAQVQVINRTCDPNHFLAPLQIIQGCKLGGHGPENELEKAVINDLLKLHRLPASDRGRLLGWERDEIRTGIYDQVISFIKKNPAERTANEQAVDNAVTNLVKARRVLAATKALDEFNRWRNNCPYLPPDTTKFTYTESPSCGGGIGGLFGGRTPPTFAEFQSYGAYLATRELQEQPAIVQAAQNVGRAYGFLGGITAAGVGAGVGAAIGAALGKTAYTKAIFPHAGLRSSASFGVAGAVALSAPIGIILFAITVGVIQGIQVFEIEQIPAKLQDAKTAAENATVDLAQVIANDNEAGLNQVFGEVLLATFPDFPATTGVPAPQASDPKFEFRPTSAANFSATSSIQYKDWDNNKHTVRLSGGWFVDQKGSGAERLTLDIEFLNAQGQKRQATRTGSRFLISDVSDDDANPEYTTDLHYRNWQDQAYVARIPNINPVITALPVERRQEQPAPETDPRVGLPTNLNISHIANISDNDSMELLNVAITSPLTSNGVTLSEFRVDPDGKVFARIQPSCSATDAAFTLQVTDSGNVTTTETINVTVTRNEFPVLAYDSAYVMPEHGSLIIHPAAGPSDDGTDWGLGFPRPWTLGEPVITPLDSSKPAFTGTVKHASQVGNTIYPTPGGPLQVSNAGPVGAYRVTVVITDSCFQVNVGDFILNVTCAGPTFTYNATNPTCNGAGNGQITLNASGGAGALLYSIDGGQSYQSGNTFTGLAAGDYFVSVKGSAACAAAAQKVTLTDPSPLTFTTTYANPTCNGASNGQITFNASIGAATRLYSIDGGRNYSSNNVFPGLAAGKYFVSVKDVNACFAATQEVTLTDPSPITFTTTPVNPICNGASNGRITVNASGGASPFMYSKDNGASFQSGNVFSNLAAGGYQIKVKDSKGCSVAAQTVTLTNPAQVTAQVSGGGLLCPGGSATIAVNLTGGMGPYTVRLSDGQTKMSSTLPITFNVSPSAPTTYTASAIDAYGCPATVSGSATVTPDNIAPVITAPAPIIVDGASSGGAAVSFSVTATDNCGAAPSLTLSKPSGGFFPFGMTTVTATATDLNGNRSQASFTVTVRTLQEQASLINTQVQALVTAGALTAGQGKGLSNRLDEVTAKLNRGQTKVACIQLKVFIIQVMVFIGKKLTIAQGKSLITAANALRTNIGC
ncbi:MAG: HYR domain-containing protein [Blastocatellales bacterium]